jgi:hypothetical protein
VFTARRNGFWNVVYLQASLQSDWLDVFYSNSVSKSLSITGRWPPNINVLFPKIWAPTHKIATFLESGGTEFGQISIIYYRVHLAAETREIWAMPLHQCYFLHCNHNVYNTGRSFATQ